MNLNKRYLPKKARRKRQQIRAKIAARLEASKYPQKFKENNLGQNFVTGSWIGYHFSG